MSYAIELKNNISGHSMNNQQHDSGPSAGKILMTMIIIGILFVGLTVVGYFLAGFVPGAQP